MMSKNFIHGFPVELHHSTLCFLDPEDILAMRKTCKYFIALTKERRLWTALYHRMRKTHTLGCSESEFAALTALQSERLLVRASKTEKSFQTFRGHAWQHRILPDGQTREIGPLSALSFLSERFILSVDKTTTAYVWDISKLASSAEAPSFPCARLTLIGWRFATYSMSADLSTLCVALVKEARAHIFSLSLSSTTSDTDEAKLSFRNVAYIDMHASSVRSIDADSCLILLQFSDTIEVVDWRTQSRSRFLLRQGVTNMPPDNYVLALRICGPYILCFRRLSVEAYPIPSQFLKSELATERPLPILQHLLVGKEFYSRISLSRVRCSHSSSGDVYTISVLSIQTGGGKFCCQVYVQTTPVPSLSLQWLFFDTFTDRRVSACALGLSGLRGASVLSPDSRGNRHVVTFTMSEYPFEPFPLQGGTLEALPVIIRRLSEKVVAVVSPQDDDFVTKCAVSEFTGQIALGWLKGGITLL